MNIPWTFDMDLHGYAWLLSLREIFLAMCTIIASYLLQVLGRSGLKMEVEVPVD